MRPDYINGLLSLLTILGTTSAVPVSRREGGASDLNQVWTPPGMTLDSPWAQSTAGLYVPTTTVNFAPTLVPVQKRQGGPVVTEPHTGYTKYIQDGRTYIVGDGQPGGHGGIQVFGPGTYYTEYPGGPGPIPTEVVPAHITGTRTTTSSPSSSATTSLSSSPTTSPSSSSTTILSSSSTTIPAPSPTGPAATSAPLQQLTWNRPVTDQSGTHIAYENLLYLVPSIGIELNVYQEVYPSHDVKNLTTRAQQFERDFAEFTPPETALLRIGEEANQLVLRPSGTEQSHPEQWSLVVRAAEVLRRQFTSRSLSIPITIDSSQSALDPSKQIEMRVAFVDEPLSKSNFTISDTGVRGGTITLDPQATITDFCKTLALGLVYGADSRAPVVQEARNRLFHFNATSLEDVALVNMFLAGHNGIGSMLVSNTTFQELPGTHNASTTAVNVTDISAQPVDDRQFVLGNNPITSIKLPESFVYGSFLPDYDFDVQVASEWFQTVLNATAIAEGLGVPDPLGRFDLAMIERGTRIAPPHITTDMAVLYQEVNKLAPTVALADARGHVEKGYRTQAGLFWGVVAAEILQKGGKYAALAYMEDQTKMIYASQVAAIALQYGLMLDLSAPVSAMLLHAASPLMPHFVRDFYRMGGNLPGGFSFWQSLTSGGKHLVAMALTMYIARLAVRAIEAGGLALQDEEFKRLYHEKTIENGPLGNVPGWSSLLSIPAFSLGARPLPLNFAGRSTRLGNIPGFSLGTIPEWSVNFPGFSLSKGLDQLLANGLDQIGRAIVFDPRAWTNPLNHTPYPKLEPTLPAQAALNNPYRRQPETPGAPPTAVPIVVANLITDYQISDPPAAPLPAIPNIAAGAILPALPSLLPPIDRPNDTLVVSRGTRSVFTTRPGALALNAGNQPPIVIHGVVQEARNEKRAAGGAISNFTSANVGRQQALGRGIVQAIEAMEQSVTAPLPTTSIQRKWGFFPVPVADDGYTVGMVRALQNASQTVIQYQFEKPGMDAAARQAYRHSFDMLVSHYGLRDPQGNVLDPENEAHVESFFEQFADHSGVNWADGKQNLEEHLAEIHEHLFAKDFRFDTDLHLLHQALLAMAKQQAPGEAVYDRNKMALALDLFYQSLGVERNRTVLHQVKSAVVYTFGSLPASAVAIIPSLLTSNIILGEFVTEHLLEFSATNVVSQILANFVLQPVVASGSQLFATAVTNLLRDGGIPDMMASLVRGGEFDELKPQLDQAVVDAQQVMRDIYNTVDFGGIPTALKEIDRRAAALALATGTAVAAGIDAHYADNLDRALLELGELETALDLIQDGRNLEIQNPNGFTANGRALYNSLIATYGINSNADIQALDARVVAARANVTTLELQARQYETANGLTNITEARQSLNQSLRKLKEEDQKYFKRVDMNKINYHGQWFTNIFVRLPRQVANPFGQFAAYKTGSPHWSYWTPTAMAAGARFVGMLTTMADEVLKWNRVAIRSLIHSDFYTKLAKDNKITIHHPDFDPEIHLSRTMHRAQWESNGKTRLGMTRSILNGFALGAVTRIAELHGMQVQDWKKYESLKSKQRGKPSLDAADYDLLRDYVVARGIMTRAAIEHTFAAGVPRLHDFPQQILHLFRAQAADSQTPDDRKWAEWLEGKLKLPLDQAEFDEWKRLDGKWKSTELSPKQWTRLDEYERQVALRADPNDTSPINDDHKRLEEARGSSLRPEEIAKWRALKIGAAVTAPQATRDRLAAIEAEDGAGVGVQITAQERDQLVALELRIYLEDNVLLENVDFDPSHASYGEARTARDLLKTEIDRKLQTCLVTDAHRREYFNLLSQVATGLKRDEIEELRRLEALDEYPDRYITHLANSTTAAETEAAARFKYEEAALQRIRRRAENDVDCLKSGDYPSLSHQAGSLLGAIMEGGFSNNLYAARLSVQSTMLDPKGADAELRHRGIQQTSLIIGGGAFSYILNGGFRLYRAKSGKAAPLNVVLGVQATQSLISIINGWGSGVYANNKALWRNWYRDNQEALGLPQKTFSGENVWLVVKHSAKAWNVLYQEGKDWVKAKVAANSAEQAIRILEAMKADSEDRRLGLVKPGAGILRPGDNDYPDGKATYRVEAIVDNTAYIQDPHDQTGPYIRVENASDFGLTVGVEREFDLGAISTSKNPVLEPTPTWSIQSSQKQTGAPPTGRIVDDPTLTQALLDAQNALTQIVGVITVLNQIPPHMRSPEFNAAIAPLEASITKIRQIDQQALANTDLIPFTDIDYLNDKKYVPTPKQLEVLSAEIQKHVRSRLIDIQGAGQGTPQRVTAPTPPPVSALDKANAMYKESSTQLQLPRLVTMLAEVIQIEMRQPIERQLAQNVKAATELLTQIQQMPPQLHSVTLEQEIDGIVRALERTEQDYHTALAVIDINDLQAHRDTQNAIDDLDTALQAIPASIQRVDDRYDQVVKGRPDLFPDHVIAAPVSFGATPIPIERHAASSTAPPMLPGKYGVSLITPPRGGTHYLYKLEYKAGQGSPARTETVRIPRAEIERVPEGQRPRVGDNLTIASGIGGLLSISGLESKALTRTGVGGRLTI